MWNPSFVSFSLCRKERRTVISIRRRVPTVSPAISVARPGGSPWSSCLFRLQLVSNWVLFSSAMSNVVSPPMTCLRPSRTAIILIEALPCRSPRSIFLVSPKRNNWFSSLWWPAKTFSPHAHPQWCEPGRRKCPAKWSFSPVKVRLRMIHTSIWSVYPRSPTPIHRRRSPSWWWNISTIITWTNSNGLCVSTMMSTSVPIISRNFFDPSITVSRTSSFSRWWARAFVQVNRIISVSPAWARKKSTGNSPWEKTRTSAWADRV